MQHEKISTLLQSTDFNRSVTVKGWVKGERGNKFVRFIHINDGSVINNIQAVADVAKFDEALLKRLTVGAAISVTGTFVQSQGKGQSCEIQAENIEVIGDCNAETYPLQPKAHTFEFLREIGHLRPRSSVFGAVLRIRHNMSFAIHKFFNDKGFFNIHTPIIAGSDAEGAGEMFRVTTLDLTKINFTSVKINAAATKYADRLVEKASEIGQAQLITEISKLLLELKLNLSFKSFLTLDTSSLDSLASRLSNKNELKERWDKEKELSSNITKLFNELKRTGFFDVKQSVKSHEYLSYLPDWLVMSVNPDRKGIRTIKKFKAKEYGSLSLCFYNFNFVQRELRNISDRIVDYSPDFFGKEVNLTVSGQLQGELAAMGLGLIYTFGPTFRAENSNTPRHLAEFWMIEPEMAFYDITDNMNLAEEMLKYLVSYALEHCRADVQFLNDTYDKELIARLESVVAKPFTRLTYTAGVEILTEAMLSKKKKFEYKPEWGKDLQKEHENFLVEHFGGPVIVTDYPKDIKSFYMKLNDDGKTVRAMDILFPWIGEIIGGSQREENHDKLLTRVHELNIHEETLWWYLETRQYGTCPHSGFGLGFERLMLFVTGMTNIRDVIPFPRTPMNAEF